ncbi:WD repeat-containing protein 27 [Suricata suricatta]|uniref:WD repeat-containing protein 27 n=1 Tax=Suricata suricatta TaxID=37032 RepID=UPI001155E011|nr:WD repeat-containing protein 27 [Suricata suricatta]
MEEPQGIFATDGGCVGAAVTEKRLVESKEPVSHVQLACGPQYCAFPLDGEDLCLWSTTDPSQQPLILRGHRQPVTALTFGNAVNPLLICSASQDYVIMWSLDECRQRALLGQTPRGLVLGTLLGKVLYLRLSPDDRAAAVCAANRIFLLDTERPSILAVLEGHRGPVTAAEFCPWQTHISVSVSDDRSFKVWDHRAGSSLYSSAVLTAAPLLRLLMDEKSEQLVLGCADGQVKGPRAELRFHVDVRRGLCSPTRAHPFWCEEALDPAAGLLLLGAHACPPRPAKGQLYTFALLPLCLPSGCVLPTSPLRFRTAGEPGTAPAPQPQPVVWSTVRDQPLVFHSKVRSSGYLTAPHVATFSPKTSSRSGGGGPSRRGSHHGGEEDRWESRPPARLGGQRVLALGPAAVRCALFSGFMRQDRAARHPSSGFSPVVLSVLGRAAVVAAIHVSCSRGPGRLGCVLQATAAGRMAGLSGSRGEPRLLQQRYKQKSRCKPAFRLPTTGPTEITSLSAVNDFYSYLVLAAGRNRTLEVFDLNAGRSAAVVAEAHSRPVPQICQNKGSSFTTQQCQSYNLFATTAAGGGIKLWDLRTLRCERRFEGHPSHGYPCGIAFSPCGRYVASGAEERHAYVYEMGSSTFSHRLAGHTDTVTDVAFSPSAPQERVGCRERTAKFNEAGLIRRRDENSIPSASHPSYGESVWSWIKWWRVYTWRLGTFEKIFYRRRPEKYMRSLEAEPKVQVILPEPVTGNMKIISYTQRLSVFLMQKSLALPALCSPCSVSELDNSQLRPAAGFGAHFQGLLSRHLYLIMYLYLYLQLWFFFPGRRNLEA